MGKIEYWHRQSKARAAVREAIRRGELIRPEKCETCFKKGKTHAHHDDYDNLLDVRFLCPSCHVKVHGRKAQAEAKIQAEAVKAAERIMG